MQEILESIGCDTALGLPITSVLILLEISRLLKDFNTTPLVDVIVLEAPDAKS